MSALKSFYVTAYMTVAAITTVLAGQMLLATQDYLTWGGVLLVYGPFVFVIAWLIIFRNVPSRLRR